MAPRPAKLTHARRTVTVLAACVLAGLLCWILASGQTPPASAKTKRAASTSGGATAPSPPSPAAETPPTEVPATEVPATEAPPAEAPAAGEGTSTTPTVTQPSGRTEPPPLPLQKAPKLRHYGKRTADGPGFLTGIGDEHTNMFKNPLWRRLKTGIARYIVPWDAAAHPWDMTLATQWIRAAEAAHQQILIAFYHSEYDPMDLPKVSSYRRYVTKFMKDFPEIKQYQPWNETNRGTIRNEAANPDPAQAAQYYRVLKRACRSCQIVGLDILDQDNVGPTIRYISEFKKQVRHLHMSIPRLWGLHNYSDTNRFGGSRTSAILKAIPGNVWLTETGGLVKFGGAFPNKHGQGLKRAAKALNFMFEIARSHARIKRLYIYDWSGGNSKTIFDAGLTDVHHHPRPGYVTVCEWLHAGHCKVKTSKV